MKAGDKILIEDLDSTNGVLINGRQVKKNSSIEVPTQGDLTIGGVELTIGTY
jgi:pSer/pThr/pTyr-binding forkhead associated (FHA) protein